MTNVVISSAVRTAIGSYGRSLKDVPPTELGAIAVKEALSRAQTEPDQVEHASAHHDAEVAGLVAPSGPALGGRHDRIISHRMRRGRPPPGGGAMSSHGWTRRRVDH